jgi:purine-binding chemotaxis protein CheW
MALEFTLARERYALPLTAVQEVTEISLLKRVPKAPPVIAGLLDVRGRVVTLVELQRVFGLEGADDGPAVALILASPDGHIGLLVRCRPQVTRLDLSAAEPAEGLIDGVLPVSDKLYNIVSPRRILEYCEKQVLDVFKLAGAEIRHAPPGRQA